MLWTSEAPFGSELMCLAVQCLHATQSVCCSNCNNIQWLRLSTGRCLHLYVVIQTVAPYVHNFRPLQLLLQTGPMIPLKRWRQPLRSVNFLPSPRLASPYLPFPCLPFPSLPLDVGSLKSS